MTEWSTNEFVRMLKKNGYLPVKDRGRGSHTIYSNEAGRHLSIPLKMKAVIARKLIKEHNLDIHI